MAQYYQHRRSAVPRKADAGNQTDAATGARVMSEYDKLREKLLTDDAEEGWAAELRRYLKTMQRDVTQDTDLIEWWQVSSVLSFSYEIH